jgi:nucleoside-diphosphate-sugar epimerase
VRGAIVRLPPTVHGCGDRGFVPWLIAAARKHGHAAHLGDGTNRWPAVHRLDSARVFRLALERATAGSILHAVADEGVQVGDIAAIIARRLGVVVRPPADAANYYRLPRAADRARHSGLERPRTRAALGWKALEPSLLADLDSDHYFTNTDGAPRS